MRCQAKPGLGGESVWVYREIGLEHWTALLVLGVLSAFWMSIRLLEGGGGLWVQSDILPGPRFDPNRTFLGAATRNRNVHADIATSALCQMPEIGNSFVAAAIAGLPPDSHARLPAFSTLERI